MKKKGTIISIWVGLVLVGGCIFGFSKADDRNFQIVKSLDVFNSVFKELAKIINRHPKQLKTKLQMNSE